MLVTLEVGAFVAGDVLSVFCSLPLHSVGHPLRSITVLCQDCLQFYVGLVLVLMLGTREVGAFGAGDVLSLSMFFVA